MGGIFGYLLTTIFTKKNTEPRARAVKQSSIWILIWAPLSLAGAIFTTVPCQAMTENMSTAVGTLQFAQYYNLLKYIIIGAISTVLIIAVIGLWKPKKVRFAMVIIPCIMAFGFLGIFERVREFIRKPYVISGYMYSNLLKERLSFI
ncbi:MAG: hypothetical protein IPJ81_16765 [Chitinophagaceae bacterium]|nr:hypothetical protein [Chitinophagaceae bacterium]